MSRIDSAVLWTGSDAAAATGGTAATSWAARGVSIDSRGLSSGDLFIALQGPNFDGHEFAADAIDAGAAAAVVAHVPDRVGDRAPLLMVEDTAAALRALGQAGRDRSAAKVVGVTGSVGKTGTKEMLALALGALGPTHANRSSHNNAIGVPLTLARLPIGADNAVVEMGMNHPGEILPLSRMARPDVAVITNVEAVHLGFFEDLAQIADAKAEIFAGMGGAGAAVLNRDNPQYDRLAAAAARAGVAPVIGFGTGPDCAVRLAGYEAETGGNRVVAEVDGRLVAYRLKPDGHHWAINSLGVLGAVLALGGDVARAAAALDRLAAPPGRGARHWIDLGDGPLVLIDDSYNASPASMRAAIETLAVARTGPGGRRIAVLGDMLELGAEETAFHAALAGDLESAGIDLSFTVGPRMAHLHRALPSARRGGHAEASGQIITAVLFALGPGDVVLVKGSLGSRMGQVVEALLAAGDQPAPQAAAGGA
ncbi:MAG: UDP-N-acetylmuramoyl-tripeptide--D-alanyl-D-alanine ligase [Alphaproteobacteria bacterium]|jgi:UDP-N-acetylmuramoyl-tripeptide--D-alanyl-D-alanine ligase|nr:UDP-N-acetylmuramoyl-tripeptide--D-alanyl-D-alanine ligase [Alphaproteobacteria bacterium]MDP6517325.1 UDP-N-acetylmuramoyl-tripeptide--D-alanyl-D-alanine ligase [Alphaproteobacteria bacterium]